MPSYQLTKHPVGTLGEIFAVSWPLILGLLSQSLMLFADRLILSNYSLQGLNAAATGGMATFMLMIFPIVIAGMSEVFVGRLNGSDQKHEIGRSVWQMIWFSVGLGPIFWILSRVLTPYIFYGSSNIEFERAYFVINSDFGLFWCLSTALMGFYIGIGKTRFVMVVTILGNGLNILLDYLFVFGIGPFPEWGVKGAAIATGIASIVQCGMLTLGFLSSNNAKLYHTRIFTFIPELFKEGIRIGFPAGAGRFMELAGHMIFLRFVSFSGPENLTIVSIVQSIYLLMGFCTEGLSKAVAAIVSNLIGANQFKMIGKVIRAAFLQHFILCAALILLLFSFSHEAIAIFISEGEEILLQNASFMNATLFALSWMCLFFLFDGLAWIMMGQLMAAQDTKFILYISLVVNWFVYVIPSVIGFYYLNWSAKEAWVLISVMAIVNFALLSARYLSGRWITTAFPLPKRD